MTSELTQLDERTLDEIREVVKRDFFVFAKAVVGLKDISPNFHGPLCDILANYDISDKLCVLPRGTFKTSVCTIAWPLWLAVRNPNVTILIVQNTHSNATAKLAKIRSIVETNPMFRLLFPEVLPTKQSTWKTDALCFNRTESQAESTFECAGIGTAVVGRHYDVIIEDDTCSPDLSDLGEENMISPSKDDVVKAIAYHNVLYPLLKVTGKPQNVIVGTRWFQRDLISHIQENDEGFVVYERAILEKNGVADQEGEPSFPEVFTWEKIRRLMKKLGEYMFSCLCMNKPLRSEDMVFKVEWLREYESEPTNLLIYTTVDPAGDPEDSIGQPDYNVVMTCGLDLSNGRWYVLDYFRERCHPGRLLNAIFDHVRLYSPLVVGVESVAYQKTILYYARQKMIDEKTFFRMEPIVNSRRSKNARIMGLQPLMMQNRVHIRAWMKNLVQELIAFPLGANDDIIDALAMQQELMAVGQANARSDRTSDDPNSLDAALASIDARINDSRSILDDAMSVEVWN